MIPKSGDRVSEKTPRPKKRESHFSHSDCKKPAGQVPAPGSNTRERTMFAVIKTGGKQYRVAAEDVIKVEKIKGEPGEIVEFAEVLLLGGDSPVVGSPTVSGATVAGEVVEQTRGPK